MIWLKRRIKTFARGTFILAVWVAFAALIVGGLIYPLLQFAAFVKYLMS